MLAGYIPIIIFLVISIGIGLTMLILGFFLGPRKSNASKTSPYECGFEAFEDARMKFDVRYYLVAILFIIFDLEIVYFFPWAVSLRFLGFPSLMAMGLFFLILLIGFLYEWRKGALEWE
ncbi:MAG: NADH-quinone oxidoreductase subunit A [Methylacidiphilales bacterium]|nr:NADH-quinone oxidoreductase subunit A [Candidatus Methylacidiphilales bacterium]